MTLKSQVGEKVASVVETIEDRVEKLPDDLGAAQETLAAWRGRARETVRQHPGLAVIGAFAIGYTLARLARHA